MCNRFSSDTQPLSTSKGTRILQNTHIWNGYIGQNLLVVLKDKCVIGPVAGFIVAVTSFTLFCKVIFHSLYLNSFSKGLYAAFHGCPLV